MRKENDVMYLEKSVGTKRTYFDMDCLSTDDAEAKSFSKAGENNE